MKALVRVCFCTHWSACLWGLQASPNLVDDPRNTWLGQWHYCAFNTSEAYDAAIMTRPVELENEPSPYYCVEWFDAYLAALYCAHAAGLEVAGSTPHPPPHAAATLAPSEGRALES